jgi:O-antigen ligase
MDLAYTPTGHVFDRGLTTRGQRAGDRYVLWLGAALTGYALLSRGFAYLGVPPLFVGEILIVLGLAAVVRSGRVGPVLAQPAAVLMLALVGLAAVRTVPYVSEYGLDAPRDFMMFGYAVYAVIVGGLVAARPERLVALLDGYRTFAVVMLSAVWFVYFAYKMAETSVPMMPGSDNVHIFEAKGGDIMVHLCGITMFVVLGMMERRPLLMFALAANVGVIMVSNRGGMVAYAVGCAVAWAMRPPEARVGRLAYAFVFFLAVGVVVGPMAQIDGGRSISVDQIVLNVKSIFGQGGGDLDGTKKWRMQWWETIWDYTVRGDLFWTGRGFGINLARADGFDATEDLRSPHNGHMTVLARMGVPGLALWALMVAAWLAALFREWLRARRAGRHRWMALFAFLAAYAVAILLNASFDVFLEGPMGGIWFWTVFGLGLAACHLHATRPDVLLDSDAPLVDGHRAPSVPVWGWGGGPAAAAGAR